MTNRSLLTVPTPAALIERSRVIANSDYMAARAHQLGVSLRPHVKTHKCVEVARMQVAEHFGGITVSTLAEVETFGRAGFHDVTYAVPLAPTRAKRVVDLSRDIASLHVLVDHPAAVAALANAAAGSPAKISVFIKIDCGYGRAGLQPDDPGLVELAWSIQREPTPRWRRCSPVT